MISFSWNDCKYCYLAGEWYGIFRNRKEVRPGRWGFFFFGLEIGSRNPGNSFGVWLKRVGLWPW